MRGMPHQALFHGVPDYRPGCLQLPHAGVALASPARLSITSCCSQAHCPAAFSPSCGLCCLLPLARTHFSSPHDASALQRNCREPQGITAPEKSCHLKGCSSFVPFETNQKNHPRKPRKYAQTCPFFACLMFLRPKPALSCAPHNVLVNACFSHLHSIPGLAETSLFQNVDASKNLFRPNNLSVLVNSCTSKTGTKHFRPLWSLLERAVFLPESFGSISSCN